MPTSTRLLQDKSSTASNLKIAALQFLRLGMQSTDAAIWQQHVPKLAGLVAASAEQRYYKVSAEALRVIAAMVPVIRPPGSAAPAAELKVGLLTHHWPPAAELTSAGCTALRGSLGWGVVVQACTHVAAGRGTGDACHRWPCSGVELCLCSAWLGPAGQVEAGAAPWCAWLLPAAGRNPWPAHTCVNRVPACRL